MTTTETRKEIKEYLEKTRWGFAQTETEKLNFLAFLYNVIPPNEMEQYISMYNSSGGIESAEDHKAKA